MAFVSRIVSDTIGHDYNNKNSFPFRLYYLFTLNEVMLTIITLENTLASDKTLSPDIINYSSATNVACIILAFCMLCLGNYRYMNLSTHMQYIFRHLSNYACITMDPVLLNCLDTRRGLYSGVYFTYFIYKAPLLLEEHIRYVLFRNANNLRALKYEVSKLKDAVCPIAGKPSISESIVYKRFKWPFVPQHFFCGQEELQGGFLHNNLFIKNNTDCSETKAIALANRILAKNSGRILSFNNQNALDIDVRGHIYGYLNVIDIANLNCVAKSIHGASQLDKGAYIHSFFSVKSEMNSLMSVLSSVNTDVASENMDVIPPTLIKSTIHLNQICHLHGISRPLTNALRNLLHKKGINDIFFPLSDCSLADQESANVKSYQDFLIVFQQRCPSLYKTIMHEQNANCSESINFLNQVSMHYANSNDLPEISMT